MHGAPGSLSPWTLLGGGVSAGIIVGVVSGLFYLVVAGIRWAGELRLQSGDWLERQTSRRFRPASLASQRAGQGDDDGLGMESESLQVREFIEKLVEKLLNGGLDDVCISKLHSHSDCKKPNSASTLSTDDRMFASHHAHLCEALARLSFALQMAIANKPLPEEDSPTAAHSALKKLIHDIIQEAMTLPALQQVNLRNDATLGNYSTEDEMALKTYEDILATAILNKVIERYQAHRFHNGSSVDDNSNLLSSNYSKFSMEQQTKYISSLEIGVKKVDDDENVSSKEVDFGEMKWKKTELADPSLSLTIEERIEEFTTYSNSDCEEDHGDSNEKLFVPDLKLLQRRVPFPEFGIDIVEDDNEDGDENTPNSSVAHTPTDIVSPVESWEENWLFQRRRLKASAASTQMPVPMLVPNPSEDFRALIGDRDAEDTSDLSECSDSALEDVILSQLEHTKHKKPVSAEPFKNGVQAALLLDIGETSDFDIQMEESVDMKSRNNQNSELLIRVTGPGEQQTSILDTDLDVREATNLELMKSSMDCSSEFGQKDSEYTEDYDAVTQRQLDSLTNLCEPEPSTLPVPKPRSHVLTDETSETVKDKLPGESSEIVAASVMEGESPELAAAPPRPGTELSDGNCTLPCTGTIAEREHKKWETAPPLSNNPYSPENISKRLSNRMKLSSSQSSSSEASVEFPDLKDETILPGSVTESLHIVCAPQDLDYKRYRRDYYVNAKVPENEKKSKSPKQIMLQEPTANHIPSQVNSSRKSQTQVPDSDTKKTSEVWHNNTHASKENTVCVNKDVISNAKKKPEPERKRPTNHETDPEIPTRGTVIHEIARWQNVINETEQLWIKNVESVMSDNSSNILHVDHGQNVNESGNTKQQKKEVRRKVSDIYLQEIKNTKVEEELKSNAPKISETYVDMSTVRQNRHEKTKVSNINLPDSIDNSSSNNKKGFGDAYMQEINNLKHNGHVKNKISSLNLYENNNINDTKEDAMTADANHKLHKNAEISVNQIESIKQNGDVKSRVSVLNHEESKSSKPKEMKVASETTHPNAQNRLNKKYAKPVPKPRTEGNIEIVHMKTNTSETVSHIQIVNKKPDITISTPVNYHGNSNEANMAFRELITERHSNSSSRQDTMSVTSEGSINSSDSEAFSFLPSVKQLAKQFAGQEMDQAVTPAKSPSPVPLWNRTDGRMKRTPTPERASRESIPLMEGQLPTRNNLSPSHPVREVHSLTARSISREFREGLKRNLPAQMDRNLYTQGSDSSLSTPRSTQGNTMMKQEGDSTPGYTSDESSFLSYSPTDDIPTEPRSSSVSLPSLNENQKAKTLQSSIAFWEQLQQK